MGVDVTIGQLIWGCFALILLVGGLMLGAAFLGGWLVFRTKRESYEGFMSQAVPTGDAAVLDELPGFGLSAESVSRTERAEEEDGGAAALRRMEQQNLRFLKQVVGDKGVASE